MKKQVPVYRLLPGDVLLGSGAVVLTTPYREKIMNQVKCTFIIEYPSGAKRPVAWNPSTTVTIESK